jgi:succinate dehydrogenase / fumarate reductase cytochrome b subunit
MRERPLSPHLSVYRFQYTMLLSITHRITGVGLSVGLVLFAAWLIAAARGPESYAHAMLVLGSAPLRVLYALWLLAFAYHLANGIRHLAWDLGVGLEKREARRSAWIVIVGAIVLFLVLAWFALVVRGEAP